MWELNCSVVRPLTEVERFQFETSGSEKPEGWRSLADLLPHREYQDLTDQVPDAEEVEEPDLPPEPDSTTTTIPTRRVTRKTTMRPSALPSVTESDELGTTSTKRPAPMSSATPSSTAGDPNSTTTTAPSPLATIPSSSTTAPGEPVNEYEEADSKCARVEDWVANLHKAVAEEANVMDIYSAFLEAPECLKVEFDIDAPTSNRQRKALERNPVLYLVKKMKDSEVSLVKLPAHEKVLFQRAKTKEVDSFIKHEAVRRCLDDQEIRKAYDSHRIVRARWVLTWKCTPDDEREEAQQDAQQNPKTVFTSDGGEKAKARIVLLGFEHPNLLDPTFKTSSPVQSTLGRNLLYSMSAQHQWPLEGLDLATAFLTQATEADREIWTSGVAELREALGVGAEGIMRVLRNIYGSTTAPRGLWLDLHKTLTSLGGHAVKGERCLWIWLSKDRMDSLNGKQFPKVIGAMGSHVDDFHRIGDGSPEWLAVKEQINKAYNWGMTKVGNYRHAGTDVSSVYDATGKFKIWSISSTTLTVFPTSTLRSTAFA